MENTLLFPRRWHRPVFDTPPNSDDRAGKTRNLMSRDNVNKQQNLPSVIPRVTTEGANA
jgi:hypothetical protein